MEVPNRLCPGSAADTSDRIGRWKRLHSYWGATRGSGITSKSLVYSSVGLKPLQDRSHYMKHKP